MELVTDLVVGVKGGCGYMVKLSEISGDGNYGEMIREIVADVPSFSPLKGVRTAGLIARLVDGQLDDLVLDIAIAYKLADVDVILELPYNEAISEETVNYLVLVAANTGCSLCILPPDEDTPETRKNYKDRLSEFARAYFSQKNFGGQIYPITSYLEYLHAERISDVSNYGTDDPYMRAAFVDNVSERFSDDFKDSLRSEIYSAFGGKEEFERYVDCVVRNIYEIAESNAVDIVARLAEQERSNGNEADAGNSSSEQE